jgi:hypothetical protein
MTQDRKPAPFEEVQAIVQPIHEAYGKRLDEFNGQSLDGEVKKQFFAIWEESRKAVRQAYADHGWVEGPPDKFDTPEKLLEWLLWQDVSGTRTAAKVYLNARTKAVDGGLNPPLPTGDAAHDLLTLQQWCQQQAGGKPAAAPAVEKQKGKKPSEPDEDLVRKLRGNSRELVFCLWGRGNVKRRTLWGKIWEKRNAKRKRISEEQKTKMIDRAVEYLNGRLEYHGYHGWQVQRNGGLYYLKRPQE